jgi:hypothetical protein
MMSFAEIQRAIQQDGTSPPPRPSSLCPPSKRAKNPATLIADFDPPAVPDTNTPATIQPDIPRPTPPAPTPARTLELPNLVHPTKEPDATDETEADFLSDFHPPTDEVHPLAPELQRTGIANAIRSVPDLGRITPEMREEFVSRLPDKVQKLVNQPFGKPSSASNTPVPTFLGEARLRNTLIPILKSGFIDTTSTAAFMASDHANFTAASPVIRQAQQLLDEYANIDFTPLKTLWDDGSWAELPKYDHYRVAMMTACRRRPVRRHCPLRPPRTRSQQNWPVPHPRLPRSASTRQLFKQEIKNNIHTHSSNSRPVH